MKGFKPTGFGPTAGFKFPASFGFTGSTGAYTNVAPYVRQKPRAFKDGGYVSEKVGDPGHATVQRSRPYTEEDRESGGKSPLRPGFKNGGKWIAGAVKHPGALHKALAVPEGQKIPAKKMAKAAKSSSPLMRKRVALAKTLGKMHKADGGLASLTLLKRPKRSPVNKMMAPANTVKEKFAADGGPVRRIKDYSVMEGIRDIPALAREGVDAIRRSMSAGRRAVGEEGRSVMEQADTDVTGKTTASNYARGGKMKMRYAKGGSASMDKVAKRAVMKHVVTPAPKGHKGLGAMCKS